MGKNLLPKIILIIGLMVIAVFFLWGRGLKYGLDLEGGTSLIYEIDTQGLEEADQKDLAEKMITVLRRRVDPTNVEGLEWWPQGNTRFEIKMPLASAKTRIKRQKYEQARIELLEKNVNPATIIRSLEKPSEERAKDFQQFAQKDPNQLKVLQSLATAYDQRKELQNKREQLDPNLKATEEKLSSATLDLARIKQSVNDWAKLNDPNLQKTLKEFLGSESNLELLTDYVKTYAQWAEVVNQLPDKYAEFEQAKRELDKLNLTAEQVEFVLEMSPKAVARRGQIKELKGNFPDRANEIEALVAASDNYRYRRFRVFGLFTAYQRIPPGLDDPKDLERMLKGAGILEFRILPTSDRTELTPDEINSFIELLKTKGPKYASDDRYVWCEIESPDNWRMPNSIVAPFGDKHYVLASNRKDETLLRGSEQGQWKLEKAAPSTDNMGRRAIGFKLDDRGGRLFANVTGKNIGRPLCILLDKIAISAPGIESRIRTQGIITGTFTQTEINDMVNKLNAGSLPARLIEQPISIRSIGPSIGADNRNQGIRAGLIGVTIVIACMAIYYTLGGSIADVALLMNLLFTLAIMAALGATFTLPGIAGTILTIGMSVDANVLIFERIREEQQKGTALRMAIKNGYQKAFSAIFDSNLTTVISAAVLYWVGSEDIKGFAIVLMLGLISNLFTAVFATRVIFDWLLAKRLIKERLIMLQLIRRPNINWMRFRPVFFTISGILTIGGLAIFFTRNDVKNSKYDIEFTGGTIVQINLKEGVSLSRGDVENKIRQVDIGNNALAAASVYSVGKTGKSYEITTTATNKTTAAITFTESGQTVQSVTAAITKAEAQFPRRLSNLVVTPFSPRPTGGGASAAGAEAKAFLVSTSQISPSLVKNVLAAAFPNAQVSEPQVDEVVNNAVKTAFEGELEIQRNLEPQITSKNKITSELADAEPELVDFMGGIKIQCRTAKPTTAQELDQRMGDLRFKPDMQSLDWSVRYKIFGSDMKTMDPNQQVDSFVYVSAQPEAGLRELTEDEWTRFVENETTKVQAATTLETSLPRVTQISPSVGAEARTRALVAIVLTLIAMLAYIWFRFGDLRFGFGAIITLFHDTCVNVGMVTACTYIAATFIGQKLLIGDFKINLAMIAAFLTLLGYSINDTIVIYDRIRENRRKGTLTPQIINDSINDTLSRTLLTGTTTIIVVFIMYIFGGQGLRGFNFAMLFGIIEGTYSSIAISAPILLLGAKSSSQGRK